jgi:hypothetical protein
LGKLLTRWLQFGRKDSAGSAHPEPHAADYRAVSIVSRAGSCAEAKQKRGVRYLLSEVPRLPLPTCPDPLTCPCSYRKFADRRVTQRRDIASSGRWYMGLDRRKSSGRRASDHHLSRIEINWPHRE